MFATEQAACVTPVVATSCQAQTSTPAAGIYFALPAGGRQFQHMPMNAIAVADYADGLPMAIIQGNIGLIGCHPESEEFWYEDQYKYINKFWHKGEHHEMLLGFVDKLMEHSSIG